MPVADDDDDDVAAAANYTASFENGVCRLTLERVSADDAATFACRATNEAGTVQSSATLSVLGKLIASTRTYVDTTAAQSAASTLRRPPSATLHRLFARAFHTPPPLARIGPAAAALRD